MAPSEPHDTTTGSQEALPPAIIANAEAAIAANAQAPTTRRSYPAEKSPDSSSTSAQTPSNYTGNTHGLDHDGFVDGELPPPAYHEHQDEIQLEHDGLNTEAKLTDDGRVNIKINQSSHRLSNFLVPALRNQLSLVEQENQQPLPPGYIPPALGGLPGQTPPPKLNIVIHVVGSRGDVQPFVALGKTLILTYGHRVRLATHPVFQPFVEENGLEFFSIGGDPAELMAFMVKNPGLMPGFDTLKSGDIGKRRKGIEEILSGCWRSCIEAGDGLSSNVRRDSDASSNGFVDGINMDASPTASPFIADCIIANPPSFAHVHIAEKLGIPLHMMFTMPWSPTQSFPHPLANIQSSNADVKMTNFMSYALVEMMTWQGLGDVINRFRERALGLDPISLIWAPGILARLRVPYTYCWSPALIPKPKDWGQHIDISGFYFLSLASSYNPAPDLAEFLAAGPPPVYIGFGSIVVDDPNAMTDMIFEAVRKTGTRALVSKGWGGLGADSLTLPEGVFMLGNVPHDWLFKHVSCVVHHGGAGTTAAGIALGKPTVVVPFFGDQPFWGAMVAKAGAGPQPIPFKQLTADKLSEAITFALEPATLDKAKELGARISEEKGSEVGGKSFHDHLQVDDMRCSLAPSRSAVWRVKRTETRLSAFAATALANEGLISFSDLKLFRPREYDVDNGPWDPISGGASALVGTMVSLGMGVADFPVEIFKIFKSRSKLVTGDQGSDSQSIASPSLNRASTSTLGSSVSQTSTNSQAHGPALSTTSTTSTLDGNGRSMSSTSVGTAPTSSGTAFTNSMKDALAGRLERSRSRSRIRHARSMSAPREEGSGANQISVESVVGTGKGLSRIVGAGLKSPMDFTLGMARGFHNAPKLYGDDTVRPQERVTDLQSGLKAAGKNFGLGMYDGLSGLVTQPMRGAEKEGAAGLLKGIGKGIGGLVFKPGAAIWGLPGYTFMGIHKEVRKLFGSSALNYIISARTAQGYADWNTSTPEERADVIQRWHVHKAEFQSERQRVLEDGPEGQSKGRLSPKGFLQTRHLSFDERKKLHDDRLKRREKEKKGKQKDSEQDVGVEEHPHDNRTPSIPTQSLSPVPSASEFEEAIQNSIQATSQGDPEQDEIIERAIRASIAELQRAQASSSLSEQEAMDRAVQASITEANRGRSQQQGMADRDADLERSIQESLQHAQSRHESSEGQIGLRDQEAGEEEEMKRALEASKSTHEEHEQSSSAARTEEDIVLEYVKKQSLAEEQHKSALRMNSEGEPLASGDHDEDLKKALEESMKTK